jgi:hypothetical protein
LVSASPDLLRTMLTTFINTLMSAEADAICGAPYGQLSPERTNGSKSCVWHAAATASRLTCRVMQVQRRRDAPAPLSTGCPRAQRARSSVVRCQVREAHRVEGDAGQDRGEDGGAGPVARHELTTAATTTQTTTGRQQHTVKPGRGADRGPEARVSCFWVSGVLPSLSLRRAPGLPPRDRSCDRNE